MGLGGGGAKGSGGSTRSACWLQLGLWDGGRVGVPVERGLGGLGRCLTGHPQHPIAVLVQQRNARPGPRSSPCVPSRCVLYPSKSSIIVLST